MTDPAYSRETLRIIDANLNRAAEGLRVLEDIARLGLNDASLSERLKTLRHELTQHRSGPPRGADSGARRGHRRGQRRAGAGRSQHDGTSPPP